MAEPLKYKEEYCGLLIDHMKKGHSFRSFTSVARVSRKTLYEWVKSYPEFEEAKEMAKGEALLFYEKLLSAKVSGQKINNFDPKKSDTACLIFAMKTRFHKVYGDPTKLEQDRNDININISKDDEKM